LIEVPTLGYEETRVYDEHLKELISESYKKGVLKPSENDASERPSEIKTFTAEI